jgi:hypothetical protein
MRSHGSDDRLEAGLGQNLLAGGLMSDVFVFQPNGVSQTQIADFEPWDRLDLSGFGYTSADDARVHLRQQGSDIIFEDQGVTVRLLQTPLSVMTNDVFLL